MLWVLNRLGWAPLLLENCRTVKAGVPAVRAAASPSRRPASCGRRTVLRGKSVTSDARRCCRRYWRIGRHRAGGRPAALAARGMSVCLTGRDVAVAGYATEIGQRRAAGPRATLPISRPNEEIRGLVVRGRRDIGRIDVLVHAAGRYALAISSPSAGTT